MDATETKDQLKKELCRIIDTLEYEERNQRDLMNWSAGGNDRTVWRFTNQEEIINRLIAQIKVRLD